MVNGNLKKYFNSTRFKISYRSILHHFFYHQFWYWYDVFWYRILAFLILPISNIDNKYLKQTQLLNKIINKILNHFPLSFIEADYTLDDSFWNEESPVGELKAFYCCCQTINFYFWIFHVFLNICEYFVNVTIFTALQITMSYTCKQTTFLPYFLPLFHIYKTEMPKI